MVKVGNATVHLSTEEYPGDDLLGEGRWTFRYADLERAIPEEFEHRYQNGYGPNSESLWTALEAECPEIEEWDSETEDPPETVSLSNADFAILILARFGKIGGEFTVEWEGSSAFWAFHDIAHAANDVCDDGEGAEIEVDGEREDTAHCDGGLNAIREGVPLADIVVELVRGAEEFQSRFGYPSSGLERLLGCLEIRVPETAE